MPWKVTADGKNRFRIKKQGRMRVDAVVYIKKEFLSELQEGESLAQLAGAASLPGVLEPVIALPDVHAGFGLPIGGVMTMDPKKGMISAGAVGFDINCGVRLVKTNIPLATFYQKNSRIIDKPRVREIMLAIEKRVPLGTGGERNFENLPPVTLQEVTEGGIPSLVTKGYGTQEDINFCEEEGCMAGANFDAVSARAKERGKNQLGTLGGGNHFIDFQVVTKIYDPSYAEKFGLYPDNLCIMIHCGSRGFGHQIGADYMEILFHEAKKRGIYVPFKGLAAAPLDSEPGQKYFGAMACAVNYAFCNRHLIMHDIRTIFEKHFQKTSQELGIQLVYDVAHNIAKFEQGAKGQRYFIHRKGATRALPSRHPQNPQIYFETGHPALVPGSMATPSYVVVAGPNAHETFYSVNHGAGRQMSRKHAKMTVQPQLMEKQLANILTNFRHVHEVLDEAPAAYKDIDLVVDTLVEQGITKKVAQLKPIAVMIGTR